MGLFNKKPSGVDPPAVPQGIPFPQDPSAQQMAPGSYSLGAPQAPASQGTPADTAAPAEKSEPTVQKRRASTLRPRPTFAADQAAGAAPGQYQQSVQPPPGAAPIPSVPVPAAPAEQLPAPAQNIQPEQPLLMPKRRMSYRGGNLQGIGSRSYQEDSFTFVNLLDVTKIREMGLFAVVADGMGGMQGGSFASQTVINTMKEAFQNMDRAGDLPEQLEHAIYAADENVFRELHGKGGSTVVAAMLYDEKLYYAGVGDSYFFLKRGNALYRINREQNVMHSVFLDTIRQGSVDPSAGEANEEKQALSQFVGMGEIIDVDQLYHPFPLMDGDILLLCSDGVGGVLTEEDILFALAHPSPQDMCTALDQSVQRANRTYQDNYTALVIQCSY